MKKVKKTIETGQLTTRDARLRQLLQAERRQMDDNVRERMRDGRTDGPLDARDVVDIADATLQQEIDLALLQMRVATVGRIDEALRRLDDGRYGSCFECEEAIAESRLRALPFAVRCRACEEKRETKQRNTRQVALRAHTPFAHVTG